MTNTVPSNRGTEDWTGLEYIHALLRRCSKKDLRRKQKTTLKICPRWEIQKSASNERLMGKYHLFSLSHFWSLPIAATCLLLIFSRINFAVSGPIFQYLSILYTEYFWLSSYNLLNSTVTFPIRRKQNTNHY
jgi:hypothetical protein